MVVSADHLHSPLGTWQGTVIQKPLTKELELFSTRPGSDESLLHTIYFVKLCAFGDLNIFTFEKGLFTPILPMSQMFNCHTG